MAKLLMITGLGSVEALVTGKRGAFYNTLEEFHKYWERIDIIAPKIKNKKQTEFFGNVFVHVSPYPLIFHPFYFIYKVESIYRQNHFNLMTVQEFAPFYNGIAAKILYHKIHVPYILEIMHIPGLPRAASLKERLYKILTRLFISFDARTAKSVRVINRSQIPKFLVSAGIPADKIKYIPAFYIDLEVFKPRPDIAKEYDIVSAGRLEKNKGLTILIEAVNEIKKLKPDIKALIIGSGPQEKSLKLKVESLKLKENIFFSSWLPGAGDVALAYNKAKIFVNSSLNEGGPRVALEAMACGLPVITTPVGIMEDIIKDGENGLFIDWDPKIISEKILKLLLNEQLQNKFSGAGNYLIKQFERRAAIRYYAELLRYLL